MFTSILYQSIKLNISTPLKTIVMLLLLSPIFATDAIIIRHDKSDATYQKLAIPYHSSVAFLDRCVATVLSDNWLVTAAHCVSAKTPYPLHVTHLGIKYPVINIVNHPKATELDDLDVALLQLKWPLKGANSVSIYGDSAEMGKQVIFVGNGMTGTGLTGDSIKDKKIRAATNTVAKVEDNWLSFHFDEGVKATEFEGVSGKEDSGGPALLHSKNGLAIVGVGCCQEPVVTESGEARQGGYHSTEYYARLSPHKEWIERHVNSPATAVKVTSPVIQAFMEGQYGKVKSLLASNQNWLSDQALVSEILFHSFYASHQLSEHILKQYPSVRQSQILGLPLPIYAYLQGNGRLFSLLIDMGIALDFRGFRKQRLPALLSWQYHGDDYPRLLKQLLSKGFDINEVDERGDSALHMAIFFDSPQRAELLLSLGADLHLPDNHGNTALLDAARLGNEHMVKLLLRHGANVQHKNHDQQSAIDIATVMGNKSITEMLTIHQ